MVQPTRRRLLAATAGLAGGLAGCSAGRRESPNTVEAGGEPHEVTVKIASDTEGAVFDVSAEYDDAAAVARETDLPVREVMRRAETAYRS